jgi:hypothetical protein
MGNPVFSRRQLYGMGALSRRCLAETANILRCDESTGVGTTRGMEKKDKHDISRCYSDDRTRGDRNGDALVRSKVPNCCDKRKKESALLICGFAHTTGIAEVVRDNMGHVDIRRDPESLRQERVGRAGGCGLPAQTSAVGQFPIAHELNSRY